MCYSERCAWREMSEVGVYGGEVLRELCWCESGGEVLKELCWCANGVCHLHAVMVTVICSVSYTVQ